MSWWRTGGVLDCHTSDCGPTRRTGGVLDCHTSDCGPTISKSHNTLCTENYFVHIEWNLLLNWYHSYESI